MNCRIYAILLVLVIFSPTAYAATITHYTALVDMSGHVSVEERIVVDGSLLAESLIIPQDVDDVLVTDSSGAVSYAIESSGRDNLLKISFPASQIQDRRITLKYGSGFMTTKAGGVWSLSFSIPATPHRTIVKVGLPPNSTILDWDPKGRFSPDVDGLYVFPESNPFNFTLNYTFAGGETPIASNRNLLIKLAVAVVLVVALIMALKRTRRSKEATQLTEDVVTVDVNGVEMSSVEILGGDKMSGKTVKDSVINMLEENELRIVRMLEDTDDEITQAHIHNTTHIPKASLSDIMKRMERRNIIERKREGRSNWVKLKDWVFE